MPSLEDWREGGADLGMGFEREVVGGIDEGEGEYGAMVKNGLTNISSDLPSSHHPCY